MNKVNYLFDVDGTLSESSQPMDSEFYSFFSEWVNDKNVYIVTGQQYKDISKQLERHLCEKITGVFSSAGNEYHVNGNLRYKNINHYNEDDMQYIDELTNLCKWQRNGDIYNKRDCDISLKLAGKNATHEEKQAFFEWDKEHKVRYKIVKLINENCKYLTAAIGGTTSIDIYYASFDKSQILYTLTTGNIVFFADQTEQYENDYTLAQKVLKQNGIVHKVNNWQETFSLLKELYQ